MTKFIKFVLNGRIFLPSSFLWYVTPSSDEQFVFPFLILKFQYRFLSAFHNHSFFDLTISLHSSWVILDNYYGVNLETTLDK